VYSLFSMFSKSKFSQVRGNSLTVQCYYKCRSSVYYVRKGSILTVSCSVSDIASFSRFCITAMQTVDVKWP
jgi:hypothetical protein